MYQWILVILLIAFLIFYVWYFLLPLLHGAPFVPTKKENIQSLFDIIKDLNLTTTKVVDLGSGDGRIPIFLANHEIPCDGIEVSKYLCNVSNKKINEENLSLKCKIFNQSFFDTDLSPYDLVVLFQTPYIMNKLGIKLQNELKTDSIVASYCFTFPTLTQIMEKDGWYIYKI